MEGASSTSEIEEDTRAGIVLPTDQESSSAEMDETSPAASTPEVRSDTGGGGGTPLASKEWS